MKRTTLIGLLVSSLALVAVSLSPVFSSSNSSSARQIVGAARNGRSSIELIGLIQQDGANFVGYGYLTHLSGLNDSLLFTDPADQSESTARFTFVAESTLDKRSTLNNVVNIASSGDLAIYFHRGGAGADFAQPDSFQSAKQLASLKIRFQNILNIQTPGPPARGITTLFADSRQRESAGFRLEGRRFLFGTVGLRHRFEAAGEGVRPDPTMEPPQTTTTFAGNARVGR